MPTQIQWLRARAIHAYLRHGDGVNGHRHRSGFAFCDNLPQILCSDFGKAFALLTAYLIAVFLLYFAQGEEATRDTRAGRRSHSVKRAHRVRSSSRATG